MAPQKAMSGINNLPKNKGGRAYIPTDGSVPRGFLESHSIKNYGWIFTTIKEGRAGYVKSRL